jgi:hypothetical protein
MATASVTSNEGALESASAVLEVTATNPEYNQPALGIKQASKRNASDTGFETVVVFQRVAAGGNIGLRTASQFGGGQGAMAIANVSVAPSINPAGGGILHVEDRALKYRGSNGTITVIARRRRMWPSSNRRPARIIVIAQIAVHE